VQVAQFERAEAMLRQAVSINEKSSGLGHPATAAALQALSGVLLTAGKLAEAEVLCRRALGMRKRVLGLDHPDTLSSVDTLGVILCAQVGRLMVVLKY
jgi:Tetratricopeptide repeat